MVRRIGQLGDGLARVELGDGSSDPKFWTFISVSVPAGPIELIGAVANLCRSTPSRKCGEPGSRAGSGYLR